MKQNRNKLINKYLKKEMSQEEIKAFENELKRNRQMQKDFMIERSFYVAAQDAGRQKLRERFAKLETERKTINMMPYASKSDEIMKWVSKAAFMYQSNLNSTSLPITDETINDFLSDDENNK